MTLHVFICPRCQRIGPEGPCMAHPASYRPERVELVPRGTLESELDRFRRDLLAANRKERMNASSAPGKTAVTTDYPTVMDVHRHPTGTLDGPECIGVQVNGTTCYPLSPNQALTLARDLIQMVKAVGGGPCCDGKAATCTNPGFLQVADGRVLCVDCYASSPPCESKRREREITVADDILREEVASAYDAGDERLAVRLREVRNLLAEWRVEGE